MIEVVAESNNNNRIERAHILCISLPRPQRVTTIIELKALKGKHVEETVITIVELEVICSCPYVY